MLNDYSAKMALGLFGKFCGGFLAVLWYIGGAKRAPPIGINIQTGKLMLATSFSG